jgi:RNA polymerase sigma-70 factor (ECF subfamily)
MAELVSRKFEEMYKAHYDALRNSAQHIIGDNDASHDIVQEVFLKLWHRREELNFILNQKAYLFKSVINASITYLEKNKKIVPFLEMEIESPRNADSKMLLKELEVKVQLALNNLPPKCKAVFVLSRFEELKNKEIAELLGLSLKTVENQMGIAIKKMREELHPYLTKDIIALAVSAGLSVLVHFL